MNTEKKIAVLGSGVMGAGIAQVAAAAGHQTFLFDISAGALEKAKIGFAADLEKGVKLGKVSPGGKKQTTKNLSFTREIDDIANVDLVIEAVPENLELKKKVLSEVSELISPNAIFAGNTSSFSITELSRHVKNPGRFLGAHFFNPATRMPLVEIISGRFTAESVHDELFNLIRSWGKKTVSAGDTPGFIVNRVARPFYCEALRICEERIADECTIDHAMKLVGGFRMGPFELMDLIGVETNYAITSSLYESYFHEPRYKPSLLQKTMVDAGLFGRKSRQGFYDYRKGAVKPSPNTDPNLLRRIFNRIISCLINEAAEALYYGVASRTDIDTAVKKGVHYPKGLFEWGAELGYGWCVEQLDAMYDFYHDARYRVSPWLRNQNL